MTQATDVLTAEELANLAEIAGLELRTCGYFTPYTVYFAEGKSLCLPKAFRPDKNWPHLGMVIEGIAARGLFLEVYPFTRISDPACYEVRFRPSPTYGLSKWSEALIGQLPLAICRAALVALKE